MSTQVKDAGGIPFLSPGYWRSLDKVRTLRKEMNGPAANYSLGQAMLTAALLGTGGAVATHGIQRLTDRDSIRPPKDDSDDERIVIHKKTASLAERVAARKQAAASQSLLDDYRSGPATILSAVIPYALTSSYLNKEYNAQKNEELDEDIEKSKRRFRALLAARPRLISEPVGMPKVAGLSDEDAELINEIDALYDDVKEACGPDTDADTMLRALEGQSLHKLAGYPGRYFNLVGSVATLAAIPIFAAAYQSGKRRGNRSVVNSALKKHREHSIRTRPLSVTPISRDDADDVESEEEIQRLLNAAS